MSPKRRQRGLTLVETLVALAILAAVVLSAFSLLAQSYDFVAIEQERVLAGILADNLATNDLLQPRAPAIGAEEGATTLGGQNFTWKRETSEAGEGLVRLVYSVSAEKSPRVLASVELLRLQQ